MGSNRASIGLVERDGWLHEAEEQRAAAARAAPVEPEGKLLQVGLQVSGCDRSLVGP